ncbi:B12-binding domain-containing radical SAM protein [Bacteroidota bacterium]
MKVFLVYVRDDDYYHPLPESLGGGKSTGNYKVMAYPPLGIQTLTPILRQHGHEVILWDTCHPEMKEQHISLASKEQNPDVIGISFLSTTSYLRMKNVVRYLKSENPDIPVIIGGPFATINSVNILEDCPYVDFVGRGEAEELFPEFLDNRNNPEAVNGLTWRSNGKVIKNPDRPLLLDLDRFPYPDRSSLPIDYIESIPLDMPAVLSLDKFCTVQTSRGCPYHCIYCDIPSLGGGKWRTRSPEYVLGEMQELHDQGYRSIYLTDDHFLQKRKRIQAICEGIIYRGFAFQWGCEGRVDSVAIEEFPLLKKANCKLLAFGVEAGTEKILKRLKKHQTLEQVENAIGEAKKCGIKTIHGFFLVGNPDETVDDILESFRFAARLKIDTYGFNRLCVYRGTPLWQEYIERGIIEDDKDWYKWFKCSDIDPSILPSEVVNETRKKGYILLLKYRMLHRPLATLGLVRHFMLYMKFSDVLKLIRSPFRKKDFTRKPDLPEKMIEQGLDAPVRIASV